MIRNPEAKSNIAVTNINKTGYTNVTKQKNNIILLSALALLPELISIIKDLFHKLEAKTNQ